MSEVSLREGTVYEHVIPTNHNGFVYILAGAVELGTSATRLEKTHVATLTFDETAESESVVRIEATSRAKLLVYSGKPIREEYIAHGPFVMNTEDEIRQAFRDYHAGAFGPPAVK
jgi:redox-sensitive bicupin YhaK (pirin superfamily)